MVNKNTNEKPLVEIRHGTMEFPGVKALDDVHFILMPGECHALVGENGAGKSTLAKCITGENEMTGGELLIRGEQVDISSYGIRKSQDLGIAIVHQELTLMNDMTGLENIFLGRYETKGGVFIDWKALDRRANELMEYLQSNINLQVPVKELRVAERQIVQLAKALLDNPQIIIFDELTAVLQEKDIENIFRIIRLLTSQGIGIVYISHRLDEVFEVCDSYTVLTDGKYINSGDVKDIDKGQLIKMMIGRELKSNFPPINKNIGDIVLEVKNLNSPNCFEDINITVREGEVVGLAGLVGAGKTELVQAIFGYHKVTDGDIFYRGQKVKVKQPFQAIRKGLGLVPDERRALGLNLKFDVRYNMTLPSMKRFRKSVVLQNHKKELQESYDMAEKMNLNYISLWQNVSKLSGGNQQKIVIGKWMMRDIDLFLLDEPTRGIDVGAKYEIYKLINELTLSNKSVILVSPEMDELIGLCNRIYILYEGRIMDEVEGDRKSQEVIINSLLGVNEE